MTGETVISYLPTWNGNHPPYGKIPFHSQLQWDRAAVLKP